MPALLAEGCRLGLIGGPLGPLNRAVVLGLLWEEPTLAALVLATLRCRAFAGLWAGRRRRRRGSH